MATAKSELKHRRFATRVDLPAEAREALIAGLNQRLAESLDLYSQLKQAHWNVKGEEFFQLHQLFDLIAGEVLEFVDAIAERATALGGYATGTVRMAAEASTLPEYPVDALGSRDHLVAVADRLGQYANAIRAAINEAGEHGDQSTADLYTEISRDVDKRLWFVEAHCQDRG